MAPRSLHAPSCALLAAFLVAAVLFCVHPCHGRGNQSIGGLLSRSKRRTQPQAGMFFPIAMYSVRHRRPGGARPETWEYRGQYFYGYRPRTGTGRRRAARPLAAGLPLLLAPLLGILLSVPVVVPVAQMATFATAPHLLNGGGVGSGVPPPPWGRRRRKRQADERLKEIEAVSSYLKQVEYDERQQSRVMVSYLQCNGLLSPDDHCLERLSCEFGDPANEHAPQLERTVTSILLGHMLNNDFIPRPFKKRLKSAAMHGRDHSGQCEKYFCNYVDNDWDVAGTSDSDHG